jgi:transposase InsO family protein
VSKARLVITAVVLEGRTQAAVARDYGVSKGWVSKLVARYRAEGETAFQPRSRRPLTSPTATPAAVIELIIQLRSDLVTEGHDAGPDTIAWHLTHHHQVSVSAATISRHLTRAGLVTPEPKKKPRSSYIRFEAAMPNETWQSDFTHWRLADGTDTEILVWLDDHSRYALSVTAHQPVTGNAVLDTFNETARKHGLPASVLTDNGLVYTVRFAGYPGGRNQLETRLANLGITQKHSLPNHPTTCTPAAVYTLLPKTGPASTNTNTHHRIRRDRVDKTGAVSLRRAGRMHHISIGRAHAGTPVILLIADLDIRVVNTTTGELLRALTLDPNRGYQPRRK